MTNQCCVLRITQILCSFSLSVFCGLGGIRSTAVPVEHLRTIESGIQSDWENFPQIQPSRVVRNDSVKGHYDGSVVNVPLTRKVKVWIGLHDSRKADVRVSSVICNQQFAKREYDVLGAR